MAKKNLKSKFKIFFFEVYALWLAVTVVFVMLIVLFINRNTIKIGPFEGTLPCADCSGLQTKLTLYPRSLNADVGEFTLEETYEGKSTMPYVTKGRWKLVVTDEPVQNSMVYELTDAKNTKDKSYYLKVNENEIRMLDNKLQEIDSPFNETLKAK